MNDPSDERRQRRRNQRPPTGPDSVQRSEGGSMGLAPAQFQSGAVQPGAARGERRAAVATTRVLYVNSARAAQRLMDSTHAPRFMPHDALAAFQHETTIDETAAALNMDPLQLRMQNQPWAAEVLRECYRIGAERFGWPARRPAPRAMRMGTTLTGWGVAAAGEIGAIFAEVHVDAELGSISVPRVVTAYGAGHGAVEHSQLMGGIAQGLAMALGREDEGRAADACAAGVAAAVANAVYHATGKRIGSLPITPEKLLT